MNAAMKSIMATATRIIPGRRRLTFSTQYYMPKSGKRTTKAHLRDRVVKKEEISEKRMTVISEKHSSSFLRKVLFLALSDSEIG